MLSLSTCSDSIGSMARPAPPFGDRFFASNWHTNQIYGFPMDIYLLAIESSCDDTAAAVLKNDKVLANLVASQAVHEKHGGIVPELASRAHMQNIVPVVDEALKQAGIDKKQLNAIA